MKNLYTKLMALVALLLALSGTCNTSFAQESGKNDEWKYGHFTSEAEYIQHINGGTRYGGSFDETAAPTGTVRFPAEFEKMQGAIVVYQYLGMKTTGGFAGFGGTTTDVFQFSVPTSMVRSMAADQKVVIYTNYPDNAANELIAAGITEDEIKNIIFYQHETDSYWTRDYGPWYIFDNKQPAIVDVIYNRNRPNDDDLPINMASIHSDPNFWGEDATTVNLYGMRLIHTGGNMMQDGRGVGISDELVYNENYEEGNTYHGSGSSATPQLNLHYTHEQVDAKMQSYLNIKPYHVTADPQGQYIAHVDCWGKLLAPDKILIARMPQTDARYQEYEDIANYFDTTNCSYGYPYTVYRVDELGSGSNAGLAPYTNSLILNDKVYVPLGKNDSYNEAALAVYAEAMPGYQIIGVESPSSTEVNSGYLSREWLNTDAIHCRVRGIMDFNMMFVDHRNVIHGEEIAYQTNYTVNADLIAYSGANITTANLVYRVNDGAWTTVSMSHTTGDTYTANIPGVYGAEIDYYVTATDAEGNTGSQPMMGALDPHSFSIAENPLGYIDFEASKTTVALDEYVYFTNLTTMQFGDDFCQWTLEGADPETTGATNPIVQYHTPGTYDVTFSILDTETGEALYSLTKEDYITVENAYLMHNGNTTTCDTKFYDNGGANGTYTASQNTVFTFYPGGGERSRIQAQFVSFNTETGYDALKVYDGTVANSNILIGTYSGNTNPGTIVATNPEGALTFKFTSDRANCYDGWEANITCIAPNYEIACAESVNGSISTDLQMAFAGETTNVTVTPNEGYNLETLYYLDADNIRTDIDLHMLAFAMPAKNVTVYATFSTMATQHDINISNGSSIADNVLFYDHGGPNANYSNRENYTYTFTPAVPGGFVQVEFLEFATESKYDKLTVSDGNGTIATLSGSNLPSRIISSTGNLTFYFKSDNSVNRAGWKAEVTTFVYQQYQIAVANVENGTITADKTVAFAGETVTLTATPSDGDHFFAGWNVTCGDETIQVTDNQFVMPEGNVNVSANFPAGYYTPSHYELVTSANDLEAGCKVIIANTNTGSAYAMGRQIVTSTNYGGNTYIYNYYRDAVSVNIVDGEGDDYGKHFIYDTNNAIEFYLYGSTGSWSFFDESKNGYLCCYRYKGIGGNYVYGLNTIASSPYKNWNITFYNDGQVRVRNTSYIEDMGYGNNVFDVWSSTNQKKLYLFKEVEGYWTEGTPDRGDAVTAVNETEFSTRLYPNPTTGNLTIEAEGMNHISVFNLMGQMVYDMDVDTDNMTLDMSQFNTAGMYLVRINTANGVKTERVTVTK